MPEKKGIIEIENKVGYSTINLKGSFTGGDDESEELRDSFRKVVKQGVLKILVNLADTSFIASRTLGVLLSGSSIVRKAGGKIVLYNSSEYLDNIFSITKFSLVIDICKTEEEALVAVEKEQI